MAQRTGQGASTLSQAAGGERLPTLPVLLAFVHACDGDPEEWEARWRQAAAETAASPRPDDENAVPPYRGLARFEPGDADMFFGRDQLTDSLLELTRTHRFSAVFGPSGSGKSSLLRAGLIPRLRTPDPAGPQPAALRVLTPGEHPLRTHEKRLIPKDGGETWLIVDQFEELYTLCTDSAERNEFIDRLLTAGDPASRLRVILAVRADFLGHCAQHSALTAALQHGTLLAGPMSRDELREAIVKPAQSAGLIVERSLTARLLDDVEEEPGALPLLSHALLETWHRRKGRALTESAYEAAGGLHGAIARTAEVAYTRLAPGQADLARRVLLRLINPGDGTPDTRRPTARTELHLDDHDDTATVLEHLTRARLLTLDGDTVDLAHEALISSWPRLRAWIEEDRERLRTHRQLTGAARTWHALGRDPGALYRGTRLAVAEETFPIADRRATLTKQEAAFLTASTDRLRHEHRRRRVFGGVLSLVVVLAVLAGGMAWQQNRSSEHRRTEAAANRVAAVADNTRYSDPVTAMRLSQAAWDTADTVETRSALFAAAMQREEDRFAPPGASQAGDLFLSADGNVLVQASNSRVMTWDVSSHRRTGLFKGFGEGSWTVQALSPDARRLALDADDRLVIWDIARGRPIGSPLASRAPFMTVFGPSGRTLLAEQSDGAGPATMRVWDLNRRRTLFQHPVPTFESAGISADDRFVALCPQSPGRVQLWRVAGGRRIPLQDTPAVGAADNCALTFSRDSRRVTIAVGGSVSTWDTSSGRQVGHFTNRAYSNLRYSGDGHFLVASNDSGIDIWRQPPLDDQPVMTYPIPSDKADDFRLDAGGRFIRYMASTGATTAAGSVVRTITLGDLTRLPWRSELSDGAWYSPDGSRLAIARRAGGKDRFWFADARTGRDTAQLPAADCPVTATSSGDRDREVEGGCTPAMSFSANGGTAAYALLPADEPTPRQQVVLWHQAGGPATLSLRLKHPALIRAIALSPDAAQLFLSARSGNGSEWIEVWDTHNRSRIRLIEGMGGTSMTVSPDGQLLAASDGRYAEVSTGRVGHLPLGFDTSETVESGGVASSLPPQNNIGTLTFSPDGKYLAAGDLSGRVTLLDGSLKRRLGIMSGLVTSDRQDAAAAVIALAFSSTGGTLAVGGDDGTVRLWDVAANQPLGTALPTPSDTVQALSFAPGNDTLYVASDYVPSQTYKVSPKAAAATVCTRADGGPSPREWHQMIPEVPYRRLC
ncbi:DNA-binding protein [Streptomyces sp. NR30]|uniref:DNA-binding protein n=2 Tax=Streptomyces guryensis TaxID=2886947 RepID=A0A9Q3VUG7_9ACTN|nr:DNA-binding protein [Streptomyces guryensis]MCD9878377.1 DNA-binding protein [Streptomyces guryensis]